VVERLLHTAGADQAGAGLAVAPEDGDSVERLMRAARDALAISMAHGGEIARPVATADLGTGSPSIHTEATRTVVDEIGAAAGGDDPVLLVGEPSSGKRYYARLFHEKSERKDGPFQVIQCAGLVDAEALAQAFGGSGVDVADCDAEQAQGGTLLLDEIGDLPLQGQRRLLRLFEEGSEDYNMVATTHRDLAALVQVGAFLPDLYAKVSVRRIGVPALRMRAESIVPLAQNFAAQFGHDRPVKLSPGAIDKMRSYSWPGNVLELRNAMERAMTLADGGEILAEHLPGDLLDSDGRLREHVGSVERDAIIKALADNNYNQTHAARQLGISRRALIYKMEKYGLKQPPPGQKREDDEGVSDSPGESEEP
jgi:DNA-binding NtrC family response regulator